MEGAFIAYLFILAAIVPVAVVCLIFAVREWRIGAIKRTKSRISELEKERNGIISRLNPMRGIRKFEEKLYRLEGATKKVTQKEPSLPGDPFRFG